MGGGDAELRTAAPRAGRPGELPLREGQNLAPELLAQVRAGYGLDRSLLEQYGAFWVGLVRGDLGVSVELNRPVLDVVLEYLPWTVALVGVATLVSVVLGVLLGAWAAWRRGTRRDVASVVGVLALDAMPGFWIGMILVAVFAVQLGWFPPTARPEAVWGPRWWIDGEGRDLFAAAEAGDEGGSAVAIPDLNHGRS